MATHYSANQYENAFAANRLQNYQVPSRYKEHPTARVGSTKIVSNDRGHLLSGVLRSKESPWGNFRGTWDSEMDCRKTNHHNTAKQINKNFNHIVRAVDSKTKECMETSSKMRAHKPEVMDEKQTEEYLEH